MDISEEAAHDLDDGERVIDRSGDIDQRPPEERNASRPTRSRS